MISLLGLLSTDSSLGRPDKSSLSQQTLIELLIEYIENKDTIYYDAPPEDVYQWGDFSFHENGDIKEIAWSELELRGSMTLKWLPESVIGCTFSINQLIGTCDLTSLPHDLDNLWMIQNDLSGTIVLT